MLIGTRPLYDNLADAERFVPPLAWPTMLRAVDRRLNVALLGPRGVGKTSLLRRLQLAMRDAQKPTVFVDATAVQNVLELTDRIRDALVGQPSAMAAAANLTAEAFRRQETPVGGASRALASLLREIGQAEATTILVDASSSAAACYELFGRMRDVLWQQDHQWVVALDEVDRPTALKPPADAFFDSVISLDPWSADALVELLGRRAESGDDWPPELLLSAAIGAYGSPREAVRALSDAVVHGYDPATSLDARARLVDLASAQGRPAGMLMAELLGRGQASASDEALQQTLGVTRARLNQLFRQLLEHGLVTAATERADGPGRPRTVYRPVLPQ
jgi:hypothetical protein